MMRILLLVISYIALYNPIVFCNHDTLNEEIHHHAHNNFIHFGNARLYNSHWKELKETLDCWTGSEGQWEFDSNITIIDNILLYAPCKMWYGIKNPCSWILDNKSLQYTWEPHYLNNSQCLKLLIDPKAGLQPEQNNGNRMDPTRLRSNAVITRMEEFDPSTMCYLLTGNHSLSKHFPSSQLTKLLTEEEEEENSGEMLEEEILLPLTGNILIVGDSVNELLALSLRNMLLRGFNQSCPLNGFQHLVCDDTVKVDFARNDFVSLNPNVKLQTGACEYPWMQALHDSHYNYMKHHQNNNNQKKKKNLKEKSSHKSNNNDGTVNKNNSSVSSSSFVKDKNINDEEREETNKRRIQSSPSQLSQQPLEFYSLLILNRGAHYTNDTVFFQEVNETLFYVTSQFPEIGIIWRNTPHGDHLWKHHFFAEPLREDPVPNTSLHEYDLLGPQNLLMREFLEVHYPQVLYIDVFHAEVRRLDARYDAMHGCVPGPIEVWSKFIYNALLYIQNNAEYGAIPSNRRRH